MIALLKLFHFLALGAGLGSGLATLLVLRAAADSEPERAKVLRGMAGQLGIIGVFAILLLWITGPLLLLAKYGSLVPPVSHWFWVKILVVIGATVLIVVARRTRSAVMAGGKPPLATHIPRLVQAIVGLVSLAVLLAIVAFPN